MLAVRCQRRQDQERRLLASSTYHANQHMQLNYRLSSQRPRASGMLSAELDWRLAKLRRDSGKGRERRSR
jgi:hypothetical protein